MKTRIRSSIVCVHENKILVFKGVDPHSQKAYWFLPGGKIEDGEAPWACAEREALEETGYRLQAVHESEIIKEYAHEWNGEEYLCQTYFYLGVLLEPWHEPKPVKDATYNLGATWLPAKEALEFFAYTQEIRAAVTELLQNKLK